MLSKILSRQAQILNTIGIRENLATGAAEDVFARTIQILECVFFAQAARVSENSYSDKK
jgi:hypothetical protein